jgi:SAM-dependent methyltransferase
MRLGRTACSISLAGRMTERSALFGGDVQSPGRISRSASLAGFARSAGAYERGRPGYPPAAVDFLAERLRLGPGYTVVDLAAGTGKLTSPLLATGAEVVAVEPVAEMRAALPAGARAVDGTAEAMPLATGSADAVAVAQAFHWFDGDAALGEIHRVLRPGGALALVWNRRRMDDPLNQAIEELIAPHRGHPSAFHTGAWRAAFERTRLFGPLDERVFPNEQTLDADGLVDRIASVSFIAALDEKDRTKVLRAARALPRADRVTIHHDTEVQVAERLG